MSSDYPKSEAADWVVRREAGLSAAERREFEAWLQADPSRRLAVARLDQTWSALDRPLATGAAERVLGAIEVRRRRRQWRRWTAVGAVAAGIAVALVVQTHRRPKVADPAATVPTLAAAESLERTLPDGSVVALKNGADFSIHFTPALRLVVLHRGEALFEVTKNPLRPFVVQAGEVAVRAVGTAFSVQLGNRKVEVLVAEGRVALDRTSPAPAPDKAAPLAIVDAGQRAVIEAAPSTGRPAQVWAVPKAEMSERLAWSRPRLEFSGTSLPEAVAILNRYNRAKFVIADPALTGVRVSGYLRADNIAGFVSMLEGSFGIRADRSSETEILLRRAP